MNIDELQRLLMAERRAIEADLGIGTVPEAQHQESQAKRKAQLEARKRRAERAAEAAAAAADRVKRKSRRLSGAAPKYLPSDLPEEGGVLRDDVSDDDEDEDTVQAAPATRVPAFVKKGPRARPSGDDDDEDGEGATISDALLAFKCSLPKVPGSGNDERWNNGVDRRHITSCHWHRHKTADFKPGCGICAHAPVKVASNRYCGDCLRTRFNQSVWVVKKHERWFVCAFCRGDCNCGPCLARLGQACTRSVS